jgi:hypothetical protein
MMAHILAGNSYEICGYVTSDYTNYSPVRSGVLWFGSDQTIILPLVLHGCETWSLALRNYHRLRIFGNRMLRRTLESKRDEETGDLRKLRNEELHNLYSSPDRIVKSRRVRWVGH